MKKIKQYKKWGIYKATDKEKRDYGVTSEYYLIHPETMECQNGLRFEPSDADWECDTMEECTEWINNY